MKEKYEAEISMELGFKLKRSPWEGYGYFLGQHNEVLLDRFQACQNVFIGVQLEFIVCIISKLFSIPLQTVFSLPHWPLSLMQCGNTFHHATCYVKFS